MTELLGALIKYVLPGAVFISGLLWLLDILLWSKPRKQRVAQVEQQFAVVAAAPAPAADAGLAAQQEYQKAQDSYASARDAAAQEPMLVEYAKSFFPVLFIVFFVRSFLIEPFQIPSGSMIPTLQIGDFIAVNKYAYDVRMPISNTTIIPVGKPKRGDVAVFYPPHQPDTYFIKRVIGLPGDRITYDNHQLTINGVAVAEQFVTQLPAVNPRLRLVKETIEDKTFTAYKNIRPGLYSISGSWVVPEGHYFMMGDNRDNSLDSRDWGFVSEEQLVGRAFAVWMHWDNFFSIPSFKTAGKIH